MLQSGWDIVMLSEMDHAADSFATQNTAHNRQIVECELSPQKSRTLWVLGFEPRPCAGGRGPDAGVAARLCVSYSARGSLIIALHPSALRRRLAMHTLFR